MKPQRSASNELEELREENAALKKRCEWLEGFCCRCEMCAYLKFSEEWHCVLDGEEKELEDVCEAFEFLEMTDVQRR